MQRSLSRERFPSVQVYRRDSGGYFSGYERYAFPDNLNSLAPGIYLYRGIARLMHIRIGARAEIASFTMRLSLTLDFRLN